LNCNLIRCCIDRCLVETFCNAFHCEERKTRFINFVRISQITSITGSSRITTVPFVCDSPANLSSVNLTHVILIDHAFTDNYHFSLISNTVLAPLGTISSFGPRHQSLLNLFGRPVFFYSRTRNSIRMDVICICPGRMCNARCRCHRQGQVNEKLEKGDSKAVTEKCVNSSDNMFECAVSVNATVGL
jgi:hypothetical protein